MLLKKIPFAFTALFTASLAQAHNVWVEPTQTANEYVVKFGHTETETYPEHKLKAVQQLQADGSLAPLAYHFKNGEAYFTTSAKSVIFVDFDNGIWSKLPNGKWVEKTKREAPTAEESIQPLKAGKAILRWDEQALKPHHQAYELVPQAVPEAGKKLAILALKDGKPVKGVKVGVSEDAPSELSDENGIAYFTPSAGANRVWAEFEERVPNNPDYTARSLEYMLTFDVAK